MAEDKVAVETGNNSELEELRKKVEELSAEKESLEQEVENLRMEDLSSEQQAEMQIKKLGEELKSKEEHINSLNMELSKLRIQSKYPDVPADFIFGKSEQEMEERAKKFKTVLDEKLKVTASTKAEEEIKKWDNVPGASVGSNTPDIYTEQFNKAKEIGDTTGMLKATLASFFAKAKR